jgi:hypothetical protein
VSAVEGGPRARRKPLRGRLPLPEARLGRGVIESLVWTDPDLIAPIRPLQLYADGGYQLRIRRLEGTPNYGPRHRCSQHLVPRVGGVGSGIPSLYPWRDQVLLTLRWFTLTDHVLDDFIASLSPSWHQMDSVVLSWLTGTLTIELKGIVREQEGTAHQAWVALEHLFLRNREVRALHLDASFHMFSQGGLSLSKYYR